MSTKLLGLAAFIVVCALAGLYATSTTGQAATSPGCSVDPAIDSEEQAFLQIINQYRQQNGKAPLKLSTTLKLYLMYLLVLLVPQSPPSK